MKSCIVCKTKKPLSDYPKRKGAKDGTRNRCKVCSKAYFAKNYEAKKEEKRAKQAIYRQSHRKELAEGSAKYYKENKEMCLAKAAEYRKTLDPEKQAEYRKKYYAANKERQAELGLAWARANKGKVNSYVAKYRAAKLNATPPWADLEAIKRFYENCPHGYEVDHIIPLQGETVCGLHVLENLQYLTARENRRKSNKLNWGSATLPHPDFLEVI
jgi:hypothetical protein